MKRSKSNLSNPANTASNGTTSSQVAPHSENAAQRNNRGDSPYQGRTAQRDNPTQLIIKQAVDFLMQQVEAGKSDTLTAYLTAMARFHNYSFGNILAIARQRSTATRVAGYGTWKELGRFVRKGEKGIMILAPIVRRKADKDEEREETSRTVAGFRAAYVFDVSQTDGKELPQIGTVEGDPCQYGAKLRSFASTQGIAVEYSEAIAPARGTSFGGRIALLPGQSAAEEFSTLSHELAHELLHRGDRRATTNKRIRETEAEATAYVVCQAIGLDTGSAASDYIQLWNGDVDVLTESLGYIRQAASQMLEALTDA